MMIANVNINGTGRVSTKNANMERIININKLLTIARGTKHKRIMCNTASDATVNLRRRWNR